MHDAKLKKKIDSSDISKNLEMKTPVTSNLHKRLTIYIIIVIAIVKFVNIFSIHALAE